MGRAKGEKIKQTQGKRVRKAVRAQEGKIPSRGSYQRTALGTGTAVTAWGRRINVVASKRAAN